MPSRASPATYSNQIDDSTASALDLAHRELDVLLSGQPKPEVIDASFSPRGVAALEGEDVVQTPRHATKSRVASKGRPYRTFSIDGFQVLVGRADSDNDYLTFRVAEPRDIWLHVGGGTPGSHVVIRNPERGEVPREVIEQAAKLAAWYSKARNASRVEVHYCRAADVSKPRGAPTGLVELARYKSVKVQPEGPSANGEGP